MDLQMAAFIVVSGLIGWLGNGLVSRMYRETDKVIPAAIEELKNKIEEALRVVHQLQVTIEGMKSGFVTRDKFDSELRSFKEDHRREIPELSDKFERHVRDHH